MPGWLGSGPVSCSDTRHLPHAPRCTGNAPAHAAGLLLQLCLLRRRRILGALPGFCRLVPPPLLAAAPLLLACTWEGEADDKSSRAQPPASSVQHHTMPSRDCGMLSCAPPGWSVGCNLLQGPPWTRQRLGWAPLHPAGPSPPSLAPPPSSTPSPAPRFIGAASSACCRPCCRRPRPRPALNPIFARSCSGRRKRDRQVSDGQGCSRVGGQPGSSQAHQCRHPGRRASLSSA